MLVLCIYLWPLSCSIHGYTTAWTTANSNVHFKLYYSNSLFYNTNHFTGLKSHSLYLLTYLSSLHTSQSSYIYQLYTIQPPRSLYLSLSCPKVPLLSNSATATSAHLNELPKDFLQFIQPLSHVSISELSTGPLYYRISHMTENQLLKLSYPGPLLDHPMTRITNNFHHSIMLSLSLTPKILTWHRNPTKQSGSLQTWLDIAPVIKLVTLIHLFVLCS